MEGLLQGKGGFCAGSRFYLETFLQELLVTVKCLSHCTPSPDHNSGQQCLISDFSMAFWFCVTELLNVLRVQFSCRKSVGSCVVCVLAMKVACSLYWILAVSLSALPSTAGAKLHLAWFATAAIIKQISYADSISWLGFIWVVFNCPFHFIVEDEF